MSHICFDSDYEYKSNSVNNTIVGPAETVLVMIDRRKTCQHHTYTIHTEYQPNQ